MLAKYDISTVSIQDTLNKKIEKLEMGQTLTIKNKITYLKNGVKGSIDCEIKVSKLYGEFRSEGRIKCVHGQDEQTQEINQVTNYGFKRMVANWFKSFF